MLHSAFKKKISSDLYMNTAARGRETLYTCQAQPLLLFLNKVGKEICPASAAVPE
jgi:hypothetical protein